MHSLTLEPDNRDQLAAALDGEMVAFFGTMLPDANLADRLVQAQAALPDEELARLAQSSEERRVWQRDANLRVLLNNAE